MSLTEDDLKKKEEILNELFSNAGNADERR